MKTYRVCGYKTIYGDYHIKAKNEEEARLKGNQKIWNGEEFDCERDADCSIEDILPDNNKTCM